MVRAWYMDDVETEQQLEHHREPPEFISMDEVFKISGVEYFQLDPENHEADGTVDKIKKAKGYILEDKKPCSKKCFPNYEVDFKDFYTEHLHTDDEVRFVLEGCAYFDVRDKQDNWIRIETTPGDMIVIPSGLYHRFTLNTNYYVNAKRYFVGEPDSPFFIRPADDMDCRKAYLKKLSEGFTPEEI